ncbi:hypothetical protein OAD82_00715 [Flavobacteriaceae bacterium]|nr:hypothetical protein [Flavobacteriaceae bacterium]
MQQKKLLYKGSFVESKRLELELISNNIHPIIVNKKQSAIFSGFGYNPNEEIFVYVFEDQFDFSKKISNTLVI